MRSILKILGDLFFPLKGVYPLDGVLETPDYYFAMDRRWNKSYESNRFGDNCKNNGFVRYSRKVLD